MRLENDSYYIDYKVESSKDEYASIRHYIFVWDDGYLLDTYGFQKNWINFEAASWGGVPPR